MEAKCITEEENHLEELSSGCEILWAGWMDAGSYHQSPLASGL